MKLLILGAGQYGHVIKELVRNQFTTIDFLDDKEPTAIGKLDDYKMLKDKYEYAIVAIGDNEKRMELINQLEIVGYKLPQIISDKAYVSPSAIIEDGVVIEPMCVIHTEAKIKKGSLISAGAVVNHNSVVKQGCHIDCNSVVGAGAVVPEKMHLNYNQTIMKTNKPESWEFSE